MQHAKGIRLLMQSMRSLVQAGTVLTGQNPSARVLASPNRSCAHLVTADVGAAVHLHGVAEARLMRCIVQASRQELAQRPAPCIAAAVAAPAAPKRLDRLSAPWLCQALHNGHAQ